MLNTCFGRETHRTEHADRILVVALRGRTNELQAAVMQVGVTAGEIDDGLLPMIVVEAVHREVAAPCVLLDGAEDVVANDAPVDPHVIRIAGRFVEAGPEGRDLDDFPSHPHMREPKTAPDQAAAPEQLANDIGRRAGRDIEILGLQSEQKIAYATTDEIGAVSSVGQRLQDFERAPADVGIGDTMLRSGDDDRLNDGAFDSGRFSVERTRMGRIIAASPASPYLPDAAPFV